MKKSLIATTLLFSACNRTPSPSTAVTPVSQVPAVVAPRTAVPLPVTCTPAAVAEVRKGLELNNDIQFAKAAVHFDAALAADPKCATAMGLLAGTKPADVAAKLIDAAVAASEGLPEGEKLILLLASQRIHGQSEKTLETAQKIVAALPDTWETHAVLAGELGGRRQWDAAIAEFKKAADLAPNEGNIANNTGYAYLQQDKYDEALASFKRYVELEPAEANSHDSYAEVLLAVGKLDESEAEFRKAYEIDPTFGIALEGVAIGKMLRGDWAGAQEALAKGAESLELPQEKLGLRAEAAFALFVEGKTGESLKAYDAIEKDAVKLKLPGLQISVPLQRAWVLGKAEKHADALKAVAAIEPKIGTLGLPEGNQRGLKIMANAIRLRSQARSGKKADAEKTLAAINALVAFDANDPGLRSVANWAAGEVASGAGDHKAAAAKFAACEPSSLECKLYLVQALEKSGDKAGAEAAKAEILERNRRDVMYVFVSSRLKTVGGGG